jgi:formylglycine-generating enzyme required for sulfatase activity
MAGASVRVLGMTATVIGLVGSSASAQSACVADLDGDGSVGATDLAQLLGEWGPCAKCTADLDADGSVGATDLATMLGVWGGICESVPWATVIEATPDPAVVKDASLRAAIVATGFPWRVRDNISQIEMLLVPPGTFVMGCSPTNFTNCDIDESPRHIVSITNPFYLGRYEVTQAQWAAVMGSNPSFHQNASTQVPAKQVPSRPVEQIAWLKTQNFLAATGLRLPTEAEWEYAYRARTTTAFHSTPSSEGGTDLESQAGVIAWIASNSASQTRPVGLKAPNALGLHDMAGNVVEWVSDAYSNIYYSQSSTLNPSGPSTSSSNRSLRGGSRYSPPSLARASKRFFVGWAAAYDDVGFRVARTAATPPWITSVLPSAGVLDGGTTITISGTNLSGVTAVTIDGVAASSVTVVDDSTLTAVTPAGVAGPAEIILTPRANSTTVSQYFNYCDPTEWATVLEAAPDPSVVTNAALRDAIIATGFPWRVRDNASQIEMLLIPPGTFNMGCSPQSPSGNCGSDESPIHSVTLTSPYYIGRYEVTQAQWTAVMGSNPSGWPNGPNAPSRPVERVSWDTVQGFLGATGLRLATEAEWEYAYRGGTTTAFHGFTAFPNGTNETSLVGEIGWFQGNNGGLGPRPVGQKAANGLGLHDMAGNVYEWVNDWYSSTYYAAGQWTNPPGPATGTLRVLRGGSYAKISSQLRSSDRENLPSSSIFGDIGFRVVRNP